MIKGGNHLSAADVTGDDGVGHSWVADDTTPLVGVAVLINFVLYDGEGVHVETRGVALDEVAGSSLKYAIKNKLGRVLWREELRARDFRRGKIAETGARDGDGIPDVVEGGRGGTVAEGGDEGLMMHGRNLARVKRQAKLMRERCEGRRMDGVGDGETGEHIRGC